MLGVDQKAKKRKQTLLDKLWSPDVDPELSAKVTLSLCSTQGTGSITDVTSQVELRKAERIRRNLELTVLGSLSSIRTLHRKLAAEKLKSAQRRKRISLLHEQLSNQQKFGSPVSSLFLRPGSPRLPDSGSRPPRYASRLHEHRRRSGTVADDRAFSMRFVSFFAWGYFFGSIFLQSEIVKVCLRILGKEIFLIVNHDLCH